VKHSYKTDIYCIPPVNGDKSKCKVDYSFSYYTLGILVCTSSELTSETILPDIWLDSMDGGLAQCKHLSTQDNLTLKSTDGFKSTVPMFKWLKNYTFHRMASVCGHLRNIKPL